jgi:hypothetical protein
LKKLRSNQVRTNQKQMRRFIIAVVLFLITAALFDSCKKYKDPAPGSDPRITNPYCNDPDAVNYNWGFPGKPDISTCFYPSDLFVGNYFYRDSIFVLSSGLFISADSFNLNIFRTSNTDKTKIGVTGSFCSGSSLTIGMTANVSYTANVDTTLGDTATLHQGQQFCNYYDTLSGTITRDRVSDSIIHISFQVVSDTATYIHVGQAYKLK